MKQWLTRLVAITVVVVIGILLWQKLFPSTEKIIRDRIARVAKLASFSSQDGTISRAANANSLISYFTQDIECIIDTPDIPEAEDWTIRGRDQLREIVLGSRANFVSLRVEFIDVGVVVSPDRQSAAVELTARVGLPRDRDFIVHEMKFTLQKVQGAWLISRVETVKTLK